VGDGPTRWHPARVSEDGLVVDRSLTIEGYQLLPDTWRDVADWCGGAPVVLDDGTQAVALTGSPSARLGDYVMRGADGYEVSPADGHYQRYAEQE
jgi:hypothetical protein